jgi:hypothetical protein
MRVYDLCFLELSERHRTIERILVLFHHLFLSLIISEGESNAR